MAKINYITKLLSDSYELAVLKKHNKVQAEHLLYVCANNKIFNNIFDNKLSLNIKTDLESYLDDLQITTNNTDNNIELDDNVQYILMLFNLLYNDGLKVFNIDNNEEIYFILNILCSIYNCSNSQASLILSKYNIDTDKIYLLLKNIFTIKSIISNDYLENIEDNIFSKCYCREKEISIIEQMLLRYSKSNIILVGESGVGKTKIIEGFITNNKNKYNIYKLNIFKLFSNISVKGELEKRLLMIADNLKNNNDILFIDDMHLISTLDNNNDIYNLLKPILDKNIKIIGTITFEYYRKYFENNILEKYFYKLNVNEPTEKQLYEIIKKSKEEYEKYYNLIYSDDILNYVIKLSQKYCIGNKKQPTKIFEILDMVGASVCYNNKHEIEKQDIDLTISSILNIPCENISINDYSILQNLENKLNEQIIGQEDAIKKITESIMVAKTGLNDSDKPASVILLKGPSGVGKTEVCNVLSKLLNMPLIRFDMTEYMEDHSVSKLIGAPPGYKDSGNGKAGNGLLINAIDEQPSCILLLDEIEKAHPKIHNLLLQIMDNAQLTSSIGKIVSFKNVYIFMTSNIGAQQNNKIGIGFGSVNKPSDQMYESKFLPEFRSRINKVINFNSLSKETLFKICSKLLLELKLYLNEKNLDIIYNDDIITYIVNNIENNNVRQIKHFINNNIKNEISKKIVFNKIENNIIKLIITNDNLFVG